MTKWKKNECPNRIQQWTATFERRFNICGCHIYRPEEVVNFILSLDRAASSLNKCTVTKGYLILECSTVRMLVLYVWTLENYFQIPEQYNWYVSNNIYIHIFIFTLDYVFLTLS
jgi:hypothetical protein